MRTIDELLEENAASPPRSRFIDVITPDEDERLPPVNAGDERIPVYTPGRNRRYPANRYVIDSIDWTLLDTDHPLHDGRPQRRHDPDDREHIRRYTAARGSILHSLIERHRSADEYADREVDIIDALDDIDATTTDTHREAYEAVARWDGSTKTDSDRNPPDARDALREAARMEADEMEMTWLKWRKQHDVDIISREHVYAHSPDDFKDDRGHGGQADLLLSLPRATSLDVEPGIYAPDIKTSPDLHHAHRMQAEAHRHALAEKMHCEVGGMIIHLTPDGLSLETHLDDEWPSEALWTTFREKLRHLYDETLLEIVLTIGDEA